MQIYYTFDDGFDSDVKFTVIPFSAHCIFDHRISDQKLRTVMVRARVRVMVRVGHAVVRKLGNPNLHVN